MSRFMSYLKKRSERNKKAAKSEQKAQALSALLSQSRGFSTRQKTNRAALEAEWERALDKITNKDIDDVVDDTLEYVESKRTEQNKHMYPSNEDIIEAGEMLKRATNGQLTAEDERVTKNKLSKIYGQYWGMMEMLWMSKDDKTTAVGGRKTRRKSRSRKNRKSRKSLRRH